MSLFKSVLSFIGAAIFFAVSGLHFFGLVPFQLNCDVAYRYEKDWGNLQSYFHSNFQSSQVDVSVNEVVFMGDSITEQLNLKMFFPNKTYLNKGIWGQTTPEMLLRFRSDVINHRPKVVVILGGINDLAKLNESQPIEGIFGNIKSMAELALVNNIQVIIASLLPVCGQVANQRSPSDILKVNRLLFEYASKSGMIYLDYFAAVVGKNGHLRAELSTDCLRMNKAGYKIMAPLAEAAIQKLRKLI